VKEGYKSHALERVFESGREQKLILFYSSFFLVGVYGVCLFAAPLPFMLVFWAGSIVIAVLFLCVVADLINISWLRAEPILPMPFHFALFLCALFGVIVMLGCIAFGFLK